MLWYSQGEYLGFSSKPVVRSLVQLGVQNPTAKHEPMSILSIAYSTFWKQSRVDANEEERFSMTSIQTLILRLQWEQETWLPRSFR